MKVSEPNDKGTRRGEESEGRLKWDQRIDDRVVEEREESRGGGTKVSKITGSGRD